MSKKPRVVGGAAQPVYVRNAVDPVTGGIVTISVPHYEVHELETWSASYLSPHATPIADDANFDILLQTGVNEYHLTFDIAAGGDAEVRLYEGTTFSNEGTAIVERNLHRARGTDGGTTLEATHTPTITGAGNLLVGFFLPGGMRQQAQGGVGRALTEWVLTPNTNYLIRGTNVAGSAKAMSTVAQWYEEAPP